MSNIVAIVGRPNVGKSTLFNRLTESRDAIVDEIPGVTRDRHYGKVLWNGIEFSVIDTGGIVTNSEDIFEKEIKKQVDLAIDEAEVIIFVLDVIEGLTDVDKDIADLLRKCKKPVIVAANKADNIQRFYQAGEMWELGFDNVFPISAINGSGTGEMLDFLVTLFTTKKSSTNIDVELPKIAIVGRPNVGKSSLINALLGEERNIVTPIAGTTRDSIDTYFNKYGYKFIIIDTAGIRKRSKIKEEIEFYSTLRAIRSIEESDVCILMIDATRGLESQDLNIFSIIQKNKKGVVLLINKWDLIEKKNNTAAQYEKEIKEKLKPFDDIPIVFTSVVEKQRILKGLKAAMEVYNNRIQRIPTSRLNDIMLPLIEKTPPPMKKGKYVKIKYITQLHLPYPAFVFFCNLPQYIDLTYKRYIENKLRENFNFKGVPIEIYFRSK